jgi:hypothetical protein
MRAAGAGQVEQRPEAGLVDTDVRRRLSTVVEQQADRRLPQQR